MLRRLRGPEGRSLRLFQVARRFRDDARGATAVEFGLISAPFFLLMMGIMTVGLHYLTLHSLEHAVVEASRQIRTGQAQKANLTADDFRKMVCDAAGTFIACDDRLVIHFRSARAFRDLTPVATCIVDGGLAPPSVSGGDSLVTAVGPASRKVSVNICYDWTMGLPLWRSIWNLISPTPATSSGKTILSAATVFQSEPYE